MSPLTASNHDILAVLAMASATVAAYASFSLAERGLHKASGAKPVWLLSAAMVLGIGLWSMHYVPALGDLTPNEERHALVGVLGRLFLALISSAMAFWFLKQGPESLRRLLLSGGLLGLGAMTLALFGIPGLSLQHASFFEVIRLLFCLLLGVGCAQAAVVMSLGRLPSYRYEEWFRAAGALVLGGGLALAQRLATGDFSVPPPADPWAVTTSTISGQTLGETALWTTIGMVTAITLATAALDKRRAREMSELNARLAASQKALLESQAKLREANAMLGELSIRDGLTGLYNRRHFDTVLDTEWRRSVRTSRPIALLMIDVDCFKALNDTYGHGWGDECLRRIGRVLDEMPKRGHDLVARYGGEEFAVLLPGADNVGAVRIAEYIRASVQSLSLEHSQSTVCKVVTVSIGVASRIPELNEDFRAMMHEADMALYLAKALGRNRVEIRDNTQAVEQTVIA